MQRTAIAGLAVLDGRSGKVCHSVSFQYNHDRLVHTVAAPVHDGTRVDAIETLVLSTHLDAADGLDIDDPVVSEVGIAHRIAAFHRLLRPPTSCQSPIVVLALGPSRTIPVDLAELSVTEEAFDAGLHPIRATVSLTLSVRGAEGAGPAAARLLSSHRSEQDRLARLGAGDPRDLPGLDRAGPRG